MGLTILETASYHPSRKFTNDDFTQIETSDEWIQTRTGIKSRYLTEDESAYDLAYQALNKIIHLVDKEKVNVIICATMTHDYITPSMASMLSEAFKFPNDVLCFDLNSACSGFVQALSVASRCVTDEKPYALVIGAETVSSILDFNDRTTCILFGDGAGVALCKKDDYFYDYQATMGERETLYASKKEGYLKMNGRKVFKFAVKIIPDVIDKLIEKSQINKQDIDYYVLHQANFRIIKYVYEKYQLDENKFYINVDHFGNTSAASIILAIDEMNQKHLLKDKMNLMLIGFGAGLSYGGTLLKWRNIKNVVE